MIEIIRRLPVVVAAGVALTATIALAEPNASQATASFKDTEGRSLGTVQLTETENGVRIEGQLSGLEAGDHALHIHETGRCEPPAFASAGGHFAPDGSQHGFLDEQGPHAGDLPNLRVSSSGDARLDVVTQRVTLAGGSASLFDSDGSALVIHAGADDYHSDPAGAAGDPVACAVIERADAAGPAVSAGPPADSEPSQGSDRSAAEMEDDADERLGSSKLLDDADTVWVTGRDLEEGVLTVESRPVEGANRIVNYQIAEETVILSGSERLELADLEVGDRVVIEASTEPDVSMGANPVEKRRAIAKSISVVQEEE